MKKLIYLLILTLGIISCSSDNEINNSEYEFIAEYSTTVTVGGIVGISERVLKTKLLACDKQFLLCTLLRN